MNLDLAPYLECLNQSCDGWRDDTNGNDVCQSVVFEYSDTTRLKVWIDSSIASEREVDCGGQYTVVFEDDDGEPDTLLVTDNWVSVLMLIDKTHIN